MVNAEDGGMIIFCVLREDLEEEVRGGSIDSVEGFVEEEEFGLRDESSCEEDSLLLST